jgi:hypothetical protein
VGPCQPVLAVTPGRACRRRPRRQVRSAPAMPAAAPRAPTAFGAAAVHAGGRRADDSVQHRVLRVDEQLGVRLHARRDHRRRRREQRRLHHGTRVRQRHHRLLPEADGPELRPGRRLQLCAPLRRAARSMLVQPSHSSRRRRILAFDQVHHAFLQRNGAPSIIHAAPSVRACVPVTRLLPVSAHLGCPATRAPCAERLCWHSLGAHRRARCTECRPALQRGADL